jgi:hypothetical protein
MAGQCGVESMRANGVIISIDGWGNSNIDFATAIEEVALIDAKRGFGFFET